jgi:hypothetical protein
VVTSFTVVNADTGATITTVGVGASLSVSIGATPRINVRANTVGAGSVVFTDGASAYVEMSAPFAYWGDLNGVYYPWSPVPGSYTIKATPFASSSATGTAGPTAILTLKITP